MKNNREFGQLTFLEILAYNVGQSAEVILSSTVALLAFPIYNMALGVNSALIGIVFLAPRFLDAILDPIIGYMSDNTRSPWGRRRPYLVIGGILAGLTYFLMWCPYTGWGQYGKFVYFLSMSMVFYVAYSIFIIPYYALGNEITFDARIRTKVMVWRNLVWGAITLLAPWTYSFCFFPYFGSNEIQGVRIVGLIFGTLVVISCLIPAFFCRENMEIQKQPKIKFLRAIKDSSKNRPFLILIMIRTAAIFGCTLIGPMLIYVLTFHMYNGDKSAAAYLWGYIGMSFGIAAMISAPFTDFTIKLVGTKITLFICLLMFAVGQSLWFFLVVPGKPYLTMLPYLLCGPGVTGFFAVTSIWLADVCDYDELLHGKRREGTFSAVFTFVFKVATAVAAGVSGILVTYAGISSEPGAFQTPQAILNLRILTAFVPAAFILLSIVFGIIYPLNEKRMEEIRAALKEQGCHKHQLDTNGVSTN